MKTKIIKVSNSLFIGLVSMFLALTSCDKPVEYFNPNPALCDRDIDVSGLGECSDIKDTIVVYYPEDFFYYRSNSSNTANFSEHFHIYGSCPTYNSSAEVRVYTKDNNLIANKFAEDFEMNLQYDQPYAKFQGGCKRYKLIQVQFEQLSDTNFVSTYEASYVCKAKNVACAYSEAECVEEDLDLIFSLNYAYYDKETDFNFFKSYIEKVEVHYRYVLAASCLED